MALKKKYKPGQLVTIDNRVYRVCKESNFNWACTQCDCITCFNECVDVIGLRCYLKLIKL